MDRSDSILTLATRFGNLGDWTVEQHSADGLRWCPTDAKVGLCEFTGDKSLGARAECAKWYWQKGAGYDLKAGRHSLAIHDLVGLDGRCDAILLTKSGEKPGDSLDWGLKLDETTVEPVHRANWYWEVGMNDDQIADAG